MPNSTVELIVWSLRLTLGAYLLYMGVTKLIHRRRFVTAIMRYRMVSTSVAQRISWLLPVVETALAALLLAAMFTQAVAILVISLLAGFTGLSLYKWRQGEKTLPCGCGADENSVVGPRHAARNAGLIAIAVVLLLYGRDLAVWAIMLDGLRMSLATFTLALPMVVTGSSLVAATLLSRRLLLAVRKDAR